MLSNKYIKYIKLSKHSIKYILLAILLICLGISIVLYFGRNVKLNEGLTDSKCESTNCEASRLKIFVASWCGHCQDFKPIYEDELPALIKSKKLNSELEIIDSDKNPELITKYGVKGFPTIILELADGTKIPYNDGRTAKSIIAFLEENVYKKSEDKLVIGA